MNLASYADIGRLFDQFSALKWFIPPLDCLNDIAIKEQFIAYANKAFLDKPTAE